MRDEEALEAVVDLVAEAVELNPELKLPSAGAEVVWRGAPAAINACWAAVLACSLSYCSSRRRYERADKKV